MDVTKALQGVDSTLRIVLYGGGTGDEPDRTFEYNLYMGKKKISVCQN